MAFVEAILRREKHEATLSSMRRAQSQQYKGNHLLSHRRFLGRGYHGSMANLHRSSQQHVLHVSQASRGASSLTMTLRRHLSSSGPSHSPVPKINPKPFLSADPSIRPIASTPILPQKSAQPQIERPASSSDSNNFSLIILISLPFISRSTLGDNITVLRESSSSTPFSLPRDFTSPTVLSSRTSSIARSGSISARYLRHHKLTVR